MWLIPQFVRQMPSFVNIPQRFTNRTAVNRHGTADVVGVEVSGGQRLDVAVEDDANELARPVDDRTAGVAANDVSGADEI